MRKPREQVKAVGANDDIDELVEAIRTLNASLKLSNERTVRLATAIEAALGRLTGGAPAVAVAVAAPAPIPAPAPAPKAPAVPVGPDGKPLRTVNWVIGPPDNIGWAYGNNAKALSGRMPRYAHAISGDGPSDIAVYFDAIVADRYKVESKRRILRIGGPRPLDRLFGDDVEAMRKAFAKFDAVIALNAALYLRAMRAHSNVFLIPNGLDLKRWKVQGRNQDRPFTVGFAASLKSSAEAETKGLAIAEAACSRLGVRLLKTTKGGSQIPHDKMAANFYSKIDVLIHPVGPGREGTSNVIMESLATGVPVITTAHAGYHSEFLTDGKNVLFRERDEAEFAEAIGLLQRDVELRNRIANGGRKFAETHHDIVKTAKAYEEVLASAQRAKPKPPAPKKIAFVPFWEPVENFGSSRLRAHYPATFLSESGRFRVGVGYAEDADVVVVIQMCPDGLMARLNEAKGQFVIYDVCDKYYENPRVFRHLDPPVHSQERFQELAARADLIIVPSLEMKAEIASRLPETPVKFVPEPIDYGAKGGEARPETSKTVLWFGNPDRGNWESAAWMVERLRDQHGYKPLIVSRRSFFKKFPEMEPHVVDWSVEAMKTAFETASLCVVAYDPAERAKSPNRFITAAMHGVPTLAAGSPAVEDILRGHFDFALVDNERGLDRAIAKLRDEDFRKLYTSRLQRHLTAGCGEAAVTGAYADLIESYTVDKKAFAEPRRIAFVSHNMALGEGAPWSLFELVRGLGRREVVEPFVYTASTGPLLEQYEAAGVKAEVFDPDARHVVRVANTRFAPLRRAFQEFLKSNRIEAVVCNTVKSAPFIQFARELGVPGALIVRESYTADERVSYFTGEAKLAALLGLTNAREVIFVARTSREIWNDQPFKGRVGTIPNGVSPERFTAAVGLSKAEARQRLGLPEEGVIALCVGTINRRKGQGELMHAYSELPAEVREAARIVFLGAVENAHIDDFRAELAALPTDIQQRLHVVEATEDVGQYYAASDIFLMNSNSEAYPRSVVEGLYFGLPILSTLVFGVREQVVSGRSGFLYEFNDMDAWKKHFTELVTNQALRAQMSAEASRSYWKLTGYNEMLLAYQSVIGRMLA